MMKHPNSTPAKKPNHEAKVIPFKVKSKDASLEYLFLSLGKINDVLDEHLQKGENSKSTTNE